MEDPFTDLEINCKSQLSILEACRNFQFECQNCFLPEPASNMASQTISASDEKHPQNLQTSQASTKWPAMVPYSLQHIYRNSRVVFAFDQYLRPASADKHNRHGIYDGFYIRKLFDGEEIEIFGDGNPNTRFYLCSGCCGCPFYSSVHLMSAMCRSTISEAMNL
jgi:hypothetical protein